MNVLVIDDDPVQRAIMRRALLAQSWKVDEAADAKTGLDAARKTRYDAIVLDFVLPDADGLDVMNALAHWGVHAPVIALSGSDSSEVTLSMMRAGAVDYVRKDSLSALRVVQSVKLARQLHDAQARLVTMKARQDTPESQGPRARVSDATPIVIDPPAGSRVLLVDDTDASRLILGRLLRPHGWLIDEASTARAALDAAAAHEPDVIIVDYLLPDANGVELIERFREAGIHAPIVALTGHGSERVAEEFVRAGATDFLAKDDISEQRLLLTLRNALLLDPTS